MFIRVLWDSLQETVVNLRRMLSCGSKAQLYLIRAKSTLKKKMPGITKCNYLSI